MTHYFETEIQKKNSDRGRAHCRGSANQEDGEDEIGFRCHVSVGVLMGPRCSVGGRFGMANDQSGESSA